MQAVKKPLSLVKNIIFVFVFIFYYLYKKPKHTLYEITVIRFLATIHPLVPKFLARFRSFIINNKTKKNVSLLNNSELIFFKEIKSSVKKLSHEGYYIFEEKLSQNVVEKIKHNLENLHARSRNDSSINIKVRDDSSLNGIYEYAEKDLMYYNEELLKLSITSTFHNIANLYFKSVPLFDFLTCWWSFPDKKINEDFNAQLFHSDRPRLSFLKFFIYLTNVNLLNGPHVVIPKSHRIRPLKLRFDRRFNDEEVRKSFKEEEEKIIIGDAGTIIAVDTQCLHKGKSLIQGSRLIAQFQYSSDFLGHDPNYIHCANLSNECKKEIFKYPKVFNKFKN
jgi:hypothetical protein